MSNILQYVKQFYLQRVVLYGLIALSSFFVIGPLGEVLVNFGDKCILYADVEFIKNSSYTATYFLVKFPPDSSVCHYNLVIAIVFSLVYAGVAIALYIYLYFKARDSESLDIANIYFVIHCVLDVAVAVLVLVAACTISRGFSYVCDQFMNGVNHGINMHSCSDAQRFENWFNIDASNFHLCLSIAVVGSWLCFLFWLMQAVFGGWKLWRLNMLPTIPEKLKICCRDT
ncbi:uncharacterized protein LOC121371269 isoform X2 [Gigantopelta aegis]|uniref:uncharacterized protein LOC121371269 isoform X2 n=1 Tax=Gigantopelta aegis TaxID=1735272 RepID=UPI001B889363|nr:uncharacterized protein LOC121371269 isoform X2 [Gigantopelta aegis]